MNTSSTNYGATIAVPSLKQVPDHGPNLHSYTLEHFQVFVHFAKEFANRFPNWELLPDPNHPLTSVVLRNKIGDTLIFCHDDNVQVITSTPSTSPYIYSARSDEFYLWALGATNVPDFINK